jgi:hypothetical protein
MRAQLRSGLLGVMFELMSASAAGAQQVNSSLGELKILGSTNSTVTVTDRNGREFRGTIADASETLLSLRIADAIHGFPVADVRSVHVRKEDSLINGTLIGATVGGGLTSLMLLDNECRDDPVCYAAVAVYAGLGALSGLGIDALIHRSVLVYTAPDPSAQRAVTVAPFVARAGRGVRLTLSW